MPSADLLSHQEKIWILDRRITRLTDNKEVQIYPMGAERYLASVLSGAKTSTYPICDAIKGKRVLVIPGYGNTGFLFAQAGAQSVTVYDKDPVTIAWVKAFKLFYHYREAPHYPSVGELLEALTRWYPPILKLPSGNYTNKLLWLIQPNSLRRNYIHYIVSLVQKALQNNLQDEFEFKQSLNFYSGTLEDVLKKQERFDTAYVPYLLGIKNGIEKEKDIVYFIETIFKIIPQGQVIVNPTRNTKEFYIFGKRYFASTTYKTIQSIPELKGYVIGEDNHWFRTQGLVVFEKLAPNKASY